MLLFVGLMLTPAVYFLIHRANLITTGRKEKILLNFLQILIAILFVVLCWVTKAEPFELEEHYSKIYMIYSGEYILYSGVVLMFTPFMWMILFQFFKNLYDSVRIRKNAVIKRSDEFLYYRGELDHVSPGVLMFVSGLAFDMKKSIAATILKLKHLGYIQEKEGKYICPAQNNPKLMKSESMVLQLVQNRAFDKALYRKTIEKEAVRSRYLTLNRGGAVFRIVKMLTAVCIPVVYFIFTIWLDGYAFENYHVWPEKDGYTYIELGNKKEIRNLYENEIEDINDYYHSPMYDGSWDYRYSEIRADKFQYSVVRKAFAINMLGTFLAGFCWVSVLAGVYLFGVQIRYFHKNYIRTIKGKALLNKAYALKNYLKDYSLIREKTEEELVLWEYYLIYAVALDVNEKLVNSVIEKYLAGNKDFWQAI